MNTEHLDFPIYKNRLGLKHQITRFIWDIIWCIFARPLPRSIGNRWKCFLLRAFDASIAEGATVYSTAKIYYPDFVIE